MSVSTREGKCTHRSGRVILRDNQLRRCVLVVVTVEPTQSSNLIMCSHYDISDGKVCGYFSNKCLTFVEKSYNGLQKRINASSEYIYTYIPNFYFSLTDNQVLFQVYLLKHSKLPAQVSCRQTRNGLKIKHKKRLNVCVLFK